MKRLAGADRRLRLYVYRKADLAVPFGEHGAALTRTGHVPVLGRHPGAGGTRGVCVLILRASRRGAHWTRSCGACGRAVSAGRVWRGALSQYGVISQIPDGAGHVHDHRTQRVFSTRFGVIEVDAQQAARVEDPARPGHAPRLDCHIASKMFAYRNLWDVGRNLHLVDEEELYWDEDE